MDECLVNGCTNQPAWIESSFMASRKNREGMCEKHASIPMSEVRKEHKDNANDATE